MQFTNKKNSKDLEKTEAVSDLLFHIVMEIIQIIENEQTIRAGTLSISYWIDWWDVGVALNTETHTWMICSQ